MKMKVHNKGQVVIPSDLRKKYNIEIGDEVDVITDENGIHIYPNVEEKESLKGSIKEAFSNYGHPDDDLIRKALEQGLSENVSD